MDNSTEHEGSADGPDQGDPAAWFRTVGTRDYWGEADEYAEATTCRYTKEEWEKDPKTVGPVAALVRAPGAVAAAPPGDEDLTAWLDGDVATQAVYAALDRTDMHGVPDMTAHAETYARLRAGWRLVPPAPPAGHEDEAAVQLPALGQLGGTRGDEAAVERAARAMFEHDHIGIGRPWDADGTAARLTRKTYRERARAALAAARGPRTPDPGAGA